MNKATVIFFLMMLSGKISAQETDSIKRITGTELFLAPPNFSTYKDNYFLTGTTLNSTPSKENSDIKYQISFKQLLSRKPVFDNSYLFVAYTQKAFWRAYKESSPFEDINFNPAVGIVRPYTSNGGNVGYFSVMFEHESNGRDSLDSRSWNMISFYWKGQVTEKLYLKGKAVIPFVSNDNPDLLDYVGIFELGSSYTIKKDKLYLDLTIEKSKKLDWKGSLQTQLAYKLFNSSNKYLMLQWYYGYGEGLLDYNKRTNMLRIGIMIRPSFLNFF